MNAEVLVTGMGAGMYRIRRKDGGGDAIAGLPRLALGGAARGAECAGFLSAPGSPA